MGGRGTGGSRNTGVSDAELKSAYTQYIKDTGDNHDGGDCAMVAKAFSLWLQDQGVDKSKMSFSGLVLVDGKTGEKMISHVVLKYNGKYYDGVKGETTESELTHRYKLAAGDKEYIVHNLTDTGGSIGSKDIGYVDYISSKFVRENYTSDISSKRKLRK